MISYGIFEEGKGIVEGDIFLVDTGQTIFFFFFNFSHFNFWNPIHILCLLYMLYRIIVLTLPVLFIKWWSFHMYDPSVHESFFLLMQPRRSRSASPLILSAYRAIVFRPDAIFVLLRKAYKDSDLGSVCRMVFISHPFSCLSIDM